MLLGKHVVEFSVVSDLFKTETICITSLIGGYGKAASMAGLYYHWT
ncbi:MAG: hypothetical protein ACK4UN_21255 [Limisphaerales bacterium]